MPLRYGQQKLLRVISRFEYNNGKVGKILADGFNIVVTGFGIWRTARGLSVQKFIGDQQRDVVLVHARVKILEQVGFQA